MKMVQCTFNYSLSQIATVNAMMNSLGKIVQSTLPPALVDRYVVTHPCKVTFVLAKTVILSRWEPVARVHGLIYCQSVTGVAATTRDCGVF